MEGTGGHAGPPPTVTATPEQGVEAEAAAPENEATAQESVPQTPRPTARDFIRLARLKQWAKGVFVLIGPLYALVDGHVVPWLAVVSAFLAFGLASSGSYVINDIRDREADRRHPRKCRRPIASGRISVPVAMRFAVVMFLASAALVLPVGLMAGAAAAGWLGLVLALYVANVTAYSLAIKHVVILDVMSLSMGFVLRVLGGCACIAVAPSTWLLNCTLFLAMFLAFGKRLGERRTLGEQADEARRVQAIYTDHLLRMMVVMTAVATLVTYAGYVQGRAEFFNGLNVLWFTMLPAVFALLRCIVLVEKGEYDDPTELATGDRQFQVASVIFALLTLVAFAAGRG